MKLGFTPLETAFRKEVQVFLRANIPAEIRQRVSDGRTLLREDYVRSQRILNSKGWAVPHWPQEWGGQNWSAIQRYIFTEELLQAAVPLPLQFNCSMVGPVIAKFGSPAQKKRFLPPTANLDIWWCQGFSEPDAGSDLASLRTRAVRKDDSYIVNGQKTWTTLAQYADWMFCLVRTGLSGKPQEGISFLLVDMKTPGVTVRPIITIDGKHEVNEVFFEDVRVPLENLVGEENKGWGYAKFLLSNERTGIARIGLTKERVARIKRLAKLTPHAAGHLWDDTNFRHRTLRLEVELKALEMTQMRLVSASTDGQSPQLTAMASMLKLKGSELQQMATELLLELAGPFANVGRGDRQADNRPDVDWIDDAFASLYFNVRKVSIYGGTNEIQKNLIARTIFTDR
jgi:alkylation response protein AidB-like acyl-CoA dehydrogenase